MSDYEKLRQANREKILRHIIFMAFRREATLEENNKLNFMLDLGKTIPEILSVLRKTSEGINDISNTSRFSFVANSHLIEIDEINDDCLRTPLEKHFHEYVSG